MLLNRISDGRLLGFVLACSLTFAARADDGWNQWGGPKRDFIAKSTAPVNWPEGGFKELWRHPLGEGYSGIVGNASRLFTMVRRGDQEVIVALKTSDGSKLWEFAYDAKLIEGADTNFGKGPNATPLLVGDRLITIGFNALAHCLDAGSGKVLWSMDLSPSQPDSKLKFGYSACPLLYKDTLIFPVGGPGSALMALRLADGSKVWAAQDFNNTYSTPALINVEGQDQLVIVMSEQVVGLNPSNGDLLWQFPFKNQWSTHVVVPIWGADGVLFVSSFDQANGLKLKRSGDKTTVEEIWSNKKANISHSNAVRVGDFVYATGGDSRAAFSIAVEVKTGEVLWKERGFGLANCIALGDRLLLLDEKGQIALAKPNKEGLNVLGKSQILEGNRVWTAPSLIGDMILARDQKDIVALKVR